ncbi:ExeM/NucH family extracellular endonuclease [Okeania sp. SIO1I7]|uniref:ExeM/NucH family extracellular endonuclease n=1 Tax=Okeania sp. SIO1I7 TaxID=2607772 RepID=UPI0025E3465F|nr:ExeM/NucH family extracellular endonuclease [Okeania sp. SIO1I7]
MTTLFVENFETDGNGTRYTTSIPEFSDGAGDFFTRTDGNNIGSFYEVLNPEGSFYFAAQDIDGEGAASQQTLTFSGIDISGFTNLNFSTLLAEDDDGSSQDWDVPDFVLFEYQIDGGGFTNLLGIESVPDGDNFNAVPAQDTDFDGDGDGTEVTDTFASFSSAIAGTGSTLDLRITFDLDAGDEDLAIDNIEITGDSGSSGITDLFISEYIEGSSNNKAIEIANFTGNTVDLSDYSLEFYFNGNTSPGTNISLDGNTVADGDVFVIADDGADSAILAEADLTPTNNFFNGDDAVVLRNGSDIIDVIGQIGVDPGSEWSGGGIGTQNETLRRQPSITDGDSDGSNSFDPSVEWEGFPQDTFDGLGSHTIDGGSNGTTLAIAPTDANKAEGDTGTTPFTFTVTRSGDTTGATSVDFAVTSTEADAGDFGGTLPSGTVNFAANETSKDVTVNVSGDTDSELDESFTVTLSNASGGATITTTTADGIIQNDDSIAFTKIHEIQGSGASSQLEGQTVTIEAVVVGDYQDGASGTNGDLNGFFVQEEDSDADAEPLTSEGLFIFDDNSPAVDVNIGDVVQVTGTVDEFFGLTQLTDVSVSIQGTDTIPTPATVNFPVTTVDDLEAFEGMGITIPDTLFVTEYFNLDRFGEIVLSSDGASNEPGTDGRLEQFTDFNAPDAAGFAAYQEAIATRRIVLDDGQTVQNPDTIIHGRGGNPLSSTNTLRGGDTVNNLSGVLSFGFGDYRVQPVNPIDFQATNPRPETPEDVGGNLKVASINVLNFFTTLDETGNPGSGPNGLSPRGADNQDEFDRQVEKLVTTLEDIDADIVGLVELENEFGGDQNGDGQFAIETLVDELNDRVGAGTYAYVDPGVPFVDTGDAISVGAIYKTDSVQVAPGTTVEVLTDSDLPDLGLGGTVFDGEDTNRAPLAVTFEELATGERLTVSVNHFKSKGGTGTGDDADAGDGQGNFNGTRLRGAEALNAWLNTDPTGSGDSDFLIVGDLNAYAQEDPITSLETEGYTDLIEEFVGSDAYSFVFDGQFGYLDYALANESLLSQVTGTTEWRVNADEPDALDYNLDFGRDPSLFNGQDPFRNSDHDPIIVGLNLESSTPGEVIEGTRRRDNLIGTDGDDTITGFRRRDTLTGGAGDDTFVYTGLRDAGDIITDFEVGSDKIDLVEVLDSFDFAGFDPIADGYVGFRSRRGNTILTIDPDGTAGNGRARSLLLVQDVNPAELNNPDNFIFPDIPDFELA